MMLACCLTLGCAQRGTNNSLCVHAQCTPSQCTPPCWLTKRCLHQPTPFPLGMQVGGARAGLLRGRASAAAGRLPAAPTSRACAGGLRADAQRARQGCILWHNWWPMLTAFFYVLVPMPYLFFGTSPASAHGTSNLASGWACPCDLPTVRGPLATASDGEAAQAAPVRQCAEAWPRVGTPLRWSFVGGLW